MAFTGQLGTTESTLGNIVLGIDGTESATPSVPTAVTCTSGNGKVTVRWLASDSGSPTSYTVTATPGGSTVTTVSGAQLSAVMLGLTNGTAYTFTVHATNNIGNSAESTASAPNTPFATQPGTLGGTYWNGIDPSTPSGFNWGYVGTSGGEFNAWEMRGSYEPGRKAAVDTQAPFPFFSLTPQLVECKSQNGSLVISWAKPETFLNDSVVSGYTVTGAPTGTAITTDGTHYSAVVPELTNGSPYTVTVNATTAGGTSPESVASGISTPFALPDGQGLGAGQGGIAWGGSDASSPPGFTWNNHFNGDASNFQNRWERLAPYAFSPYAHAPNPPITLVTVVATGGITLGSRTVTSAAMEQAATGAVVLGNRVVLGDVLAPPQSYGGLILTGSYNSGQLFPQSTFTFNYSRSAPTGCTLMVSFDIENVGVAAAVSSVIDDAGNVYTLVGTISDGSVNDLYMYRCIGAVAVTTANILTVILTQNANIEIVGNYVNSAYMVTDVTLTGSFPTSGGASTVVNIGPSSAVSFKSEILLSVIWFSTTSLNNSPTFTVGSGWFDAGTAHIGGFVGAGKWRGVQVQTRVESAASGGYNITGTFNHDGSGIAFMAALRLGEQAGAITLGNRLVAGAAVETFTAAGAVVLGNLVITSAAQEQAAIGTVILGDRLVTGVASQITTMVGAVTLGDRLVAGAAVETFTAAGAIVLGDLVISGAEREQAATGAVVLGDRLAAGSAVETFLASGAVTLDSRIVMAAAQEQAAIGAVILGNRLVAAAALETFLASGALVLGDRLVAGIALQQIASGALVLGDRIVTAAALETFLASGAVLLGDRLVAGSVVETFLATAALVLGSRIVTSSALETFSAAGAVALGNRLVSGSALESFLATGAVVLGDRLATSAAIETFLAAGAVLLGDRLVTGSALETFTATGAVVLGDRLVSGAALETFLAAGGIVLGDRIVAILSPQLLTAAGALVLGDRFVTGSAAFTGITGSVVLGDRLVGSAALRRLLVAAQLALVLEQLGGLTQSAALPLSALSQIQGQNGLGLEARGAFVRSLVLPVEGMRGIAGLYAAPMEAMQGIRRSSGLGFELSNFVRTRQTILSVEAAGNICFVSWIDEDRLAALLGMSLADLLTALLNGDLTLITRAHLLALRKAGGGATLIIPERGE